MTVCVTVSKPKIPAVSITDLWEIIDVYNNMIKFYNPGEKCSVST